MVIPFTPKAFMTSPKLKRAQQPWPINWLGPNFRTLVKQKQGRLIPLSQSFVAIDGANMDVVIMAKFGKKLNTQP
uniref:Uncharacterized protein n=1 Tax=Romanomermis culicivorax TaxID=13658 RepID=A0A915KH21_ROMCU